LNKNSSNEDGNLAEKIKEYIKRNRKAEKDIGSRQKFIGPGKVSFWERI